MKFCSLSCVVFLILGLSACEAPSAHRLLAGKWTPVSRENCDADGENLRFTRKRILYSVRGNGGKVADITDVKVDGERLDLTFTSVKDDGTRHCASLA